MARLDQLANQMRACLAQEQQELARLQRLLHQLRVLLRRAVFRKAGNIPFFINQFDVYGPL
jgi:type II secretory pathway component PulJ